MAHYAFLDDNGIVTGVIVGRDENDLPDWITSWEAYYGNRHGQTCLRTSYNTHGNQHLLGGTPFRGNYAGIGYRYDTDLDAFIPPQPFPSWTLDESTFLWAAPVPYPDDGEPYVWDENALNWITATLGD
jgi:hypothetical protein